MVNNNTLNGTVRLLSSVYPNDKIILVCDGAAWHKAKRLEIPTNIRLLFIPPYTPEMNPIEQIWKEIRKLGFKNENGIHQHHCFCQGFRARQGRSIASFWVRKSSMILAPSHSSKTTLCCIRQKSIIKTVFKTQSLKTAFRQGRRNVLIYFETKELEAMFERIKGAGMPIIHGIEQQAWGQKVFRFFDPDRHIVEIGELFRAQD